jgi:hypothetical protein
MTNFQIIVENAIAQELYTEEQVKQIIEQAGELPLHTFNEWKLRGYSVKKGEHAKLTCDIWRMKNKKETIPMKDGNDVEVDASHFY